LAALAGLATADLLYIRSGAPKGWSMGERASPLEKVEFTVALKQRNLEQLEKTFWEVSDPKHANYQNFMTIEEILNVVKPEQEDHDLVVAWLINNGVQSDNIKSFGDALDVKTTVKTAEALFQTFFHVFVHEKGGRVVRQYGGYHVPSDIRPLIEMVTGISTFPVPHYKAHLASKRATPNDNQGVVAQTLYQLYNLPTQTAGSASSTTSVGVIEFEGQNFAPADLTAYAQEVNLPLQPVPSQDIIGPNDPTNPQTEAELDIQMIASVNVEATNWFWLEGGNGWLYQFATHFFSTQSVPQVNSISYGWYEGDQCSISPDECQSLGVDSVGYVQRVNVEFQKIGLRGISLLSASGDSGANGRTDPDCSIPQLRAAFPASSPYITSVGATQLNNPVYNLQNPPPICNLGYPCPSGGQEVAVSYDVSSFASGGGFSNIAAQPSYQSAAVAAYLSSGVALPPASYFNKTGRGAPDVAAIGHNTLIEQSGQIEAVGGTSASSPIFAAVIALLNQASIAKTGQPLGFLNPFLYQAAAENPLNFNDITVGDNKCTEDGCAPACQGFLATKGWDPVTGLGSPNYTNLLQQINSNAERRQRQFA